jgi:ribonuclease VapC
VAELLDQLDCEVVPVTAAVARRIGDAYARWGRGMHPAALNFGDCFAYELAKAHNCPLLFVGENFAKTDVEGVR